MKKKSFIKAGFILFGLLLSSACQKEALSNIKKYSLDVPALNYQGHGVDFSNGIINFKMEKPLYATCNTFEALIKVRSDAKGFIGSIYSNQTYSESNYFSSVEIEERGYLKVNWNQGEGTFIFDKYNLKNNQWNFITFVRDKEKGEVLYYVNGVLIDRIKVRLNDEINHRARHQFGCDPKTWSSSKMPFQGEIKYAFGYRDARGEEDIKLDLNNLGNISYSTRGDKLLFSFDFAFDKDVAEDKSAFRNDAHLQTNDYYYDGELWETKDYTFSVIPDPQMVVTYHDHYANGIGALDTTMDFILANKDSMKIDMTMCVGDLSNMQSSSSDAQKNREWNYVGKTFAKLDNKATYIVTPGNHDYDTICTKDHALTMMNAEGRFPASKFKAFPYYGGAYDDSQVQNTYYLLETGGVKYLFLTLDFGVEDEVLTWADGIVKSYPDRRVVLLTHSYLTALGDITRKGDADAASSYGWKSNTAITINDPLDIYNKLIYPNDNFFMVVCGHVCTDDILLHESVTKNGNIVMEYVVNDQGILINDGLDSLLGLFTFDELNQEVYVDYYSTYFRKQFNIQNHFKYSFKGNTKILSSTYYNEDGSLKGGS